MLNVDNPDQAGVTFVKNTVTDIAHANGATDLSAGNKVEPTRTGTRASSLRSASDQPDDTSAATPGTSGGNAKEGTGSCRRNSEKAAA